jgi:hypothetical protein
MNRRGGSSSSDGPWCQDREQRAADTYVQVEQTVVAVVHPTALKKLTERFWLRSLQHRMSWQCVGQRVTWFVSTVKWGVRQRLVAPDELTPGKSNVSNHLMVLRSTAFSQRLAWRLGLFIPLPLCHLRLLDCAEVQRSVCNTLKFSNFRMLIGKIIKQRFPIILKFCPRFIFFMRNLV